MSLADKEAVASMTLAKTNMEKVLRRNEKLEGALRTLIGEVRRLKLHAPENAYDSAKNPIRGKFDAAANAAEAIL